MRNETSTEDELNKFVFTCEVYSDKLKFSFQVCTGYWYNRFHNFVKKHTLDFALKQVLEVEKKDLERVIKQMHCAKLHLTALLIFLSGKMFNLKMLSCD